MFYFQASAAKQEKFKHQKMQHGLLRRLKCASERAENDSAPKLTPSNSSSSVDVPVTTTQINHPPIPTYASQQASSNGEPNAEFNDNNPSQLTSMESHATTFPASIYVPIVILILIILITGGFYCFRNKRAPRSRNLSIHSDESTAIFKESKPARDTN